MIDFNRDDGVVTLVTALTMAIILGWALMMGSARLFHGVEAHWRFFDDELASSFYCKNGQTETSAPNGWLTDCIPERLDDHPSGQSQSSGAMCAVLESAGRSPPNMEDVSCNSL